MAQIEIRLPKMGESVTEATITNWLKEVGDTVAMDEPLVEVATDKVDNELPSEAAGVLVQKLFEKDQVAQVGDVIAIISTDGDAAPAAPKAEPAAVAAVAETVTQAQAVVSNGGVTLEKSSGNGKFISPLVRSIAQKENISMSEIDAINGTGMGGRVTKKDILSYMETRGTAAPAATTAALTMPVNNLLICSIAACPVETSTNLVLLH